MARGTACTHSDIDLLLLADPLPRGRMGRVIVTFISRWVEEKLAKADPVQLEAWADRVLDACTVEEVVGEG